MHIAEYSLVLCSLFLSSNGLNCRSEGGPKENELKKMYNFCMKHQVKTNNSGDLDQDWRETRRHNHWSRDNVARNRGNSNSDYGREDRGEGNRMENRNRGGEQNKVNRQGSRNKSTDNRMPYNDRDEDERIHLGNERGGNLINNRDNRSQRNNGVNDRNDFFQNENTNTYNDNQYSTQSPRRYKRERRTEVNSGKRSQYNPNTPRSSGYDEKYKNENKNFSESNSTTNDDSKTCAVHCLLENMQMTGESGMPDRYLVTHTMIKDVKEEDLKDFLQESIEECFQILDNENTDDKCEFSKNLLMCLSEKGRANCDDWKDDFQF